MGNEDEATTATRREASYKQAFQESDPNRMNLAGIRMVAGTPTLPDRQRYTRAFRLSDPNLMQALLNSHVVVNGSPTTRPTRARSGLSDGANGR